MALQYSEEIIKNIKRLTNDDLFLTCQSVSEKLSIHKATALKYLVYLSKDHRLLIRQRIGNNLVFIPLKKFEKLESRDLTLPNMEGDEKKLKER